MKKLILCSVLVFSSSAFALPGVGLPLPSIYAGLQGGFFNGHSYSASELGIGSSDQDLVDIDGGGFRAYVGYGFNPILSGEIGYAHFNGSDSFADQLGQAFGNVFIAPTGSSVNINSDFKQDAVDAVAKLTLPVPIITPYAKVGGAYVRTDINTTTTFKNTYLNINQTTSHDETHSYIEPVVGLGAQIGIFAGLSMDLSWTRYQHVSSSAEDTDFFAVGLSYNFG